MTYELALALLLAWFIGSLFTLLLVRTKFSVLDFLKFSVIGFFGGMTAGLILGLLSIGIAVGNKLLEPAEAGFFVQFIIVAITGLAVFLITLLSKGDWKKS